MVLISRPVAVVAGWQSYSSYAFVLGWVLWEKYVSLIHSLDETFCVTSYHEFDRAHEEERVKVFENMDRESAASIVLCSPVFLTAV